jgi:hypothetical protein
MGNIQKRQKTCLLALLLATACAPSEKSESEQRIVDVYESWSAEVRPASCPRYYGLPNCPDLDPYKDEIDSHCNGLSPTSAGDLKSLLDEGWRIQSNDSYNAESDVKMGDGLVLDTTCKGQRYILTRSCVTKVNLLGQETPDPRCVLPKSEGAAPDAAVQEAADVGIVDKLTKLIGISSGISGTIEIKSGNLYLKGDNGKLKQLTTDGNNLDPSMSSDGQLVAYLHDRRISEDEEEGYDTELRLYRFQPAAGQENPATILPVKDDGGTELYMREPTFSDNPRYLYAIAPTNETSGTIYRYDLRGNSWERIIDGNSVEVLASGSLKGHLLVSRHRYHPEGGSYDETFLVTPTGTVVYAIPGSRMDFDADNDAATEQAVRQWKLKNL